MIVRVSLVVEQYKMDVDPQSLYLKEEGVTPPYKLVFHFVLSISPLPFPFPPPMLVLFFPSFASNQTHAHTQSVRDQITGSFPRLSLCPGRKEKKKGAARG